MSFLRAVPAATLIINFLCNVRTAVLKGVIVTLIQRSSHCDVVAVHHHNREVSISQIVKDVCETYISQYFIYGQLQQIL